jgi:squalene-hopene/tetraprenyl-beta-curcumene cyclase
MTNPNRRRPAGLLLAAAALGATFFATVPARAADDPAAKAQAQLDKAIEFLKGQAQPDGGWQKDDRQPPAITAIVLRAIVGAKPSEKGADYVKKGYEKLLSYQVGDGGIYKDLLANYNTAIAVSALAAADDPAYKPQLDKAVASLKGLQLTDQTRPEFAGDKEQFTGKQVVKDDKDPFFGGFGYGGQRRAGAGRPDLSNTQLALDALKEAGLKPEDPAFQNAVKFLTRTQNRSESNDQKWSGDDGGFVYGPGDTRTGESQAGEYKSEAGEPRFRSYGSMTYAGLKSMIYAGLTREDPRVKAAFEWITRNWTLDENPGMKLNKPDAAQHGLYYYYHTMAKALSAYNQPVVIDAQGKAHDWRVELVDKLATLQKPDGSYVGDKRWMEENPILTTAYVVIALDETLEDLKANPPK